MPFLKIFQGVCGMQELRLSGDRLVIGRNPQATDFVISDQAVSRIHASIYQENGRFVIEDLGSTGGTIVNRNKVKKHPLQNGDNIQIGQVVMEFREEEEVATATIASDATLFSVVDQFQTLPGSMGLSCRILQVKPARVFEAGDTIILGKGGLKFAWPGAELLDQVILELEIAWPTGARKLLLGEVMQQEPPWICDKLHEFTPADYNRVFALVKRTSWVQLHKPAT